MAAGDDGVEQQLIQQLDALIDEAPDDELAAARGRRTLMDELLRKSPRVAPEGGGALLFNASPRIAPADGVAPRTSSTRVKPLWRSEASPRVAPDGGGALLFNASPRVAPAGVPEGAAPVPRVYTVRFHLRHFHLRFECAIDGAVTNTYRLLAPLDAKDEEAVRTFTPFGGRGARPPPRWASTAILTPRATSRRTNAPTGHSILLFANKIASINLRNESRFYRIFRI